MIARMVCVSRELTRSDAESLRCADYKCVFLDGSKLGKCSRSHGTAEEVRQVPGSVRMRLFSTAKACDI